MSYTIYNPIYLRQRIPFSENDCQYGERMIRLINRLLNKSKNIAFIGHKLIVTLQAIHLRQLHQNLPR